jgi:hypothetical protein
MPDAGGQYPGGGQMESSPYLVMAVIEVQTRLD